MQFTGSKIQPSVFKNLILWSFLANSNYGTAKNAKKSRNTASGNFDCCFLRQINWRLTSIFSLFALENNNQNRNLFFTKRHLLNLWVNKLFSFDTAPPCSWAGDNPVASKNCVHLGWNSKESKPLRCFVLKSNWEYIQGKKWRFLQDYRVNFSANSYLLAGQEPSPK